MAAAKETKGGSVLDHQNAQQGRPGVGRIKRPVQQAEKYSDGSKTDNGNRQPIRGFEVYEAVRGRQPFTTEILAGPFPPG
jgi:hypothetical protein